MSKAFIFAVLILVFVGLVMIGGYWYIKVCGEYRLYPKLEISEIQNPMSCYRHYHRLKKFQENWGVPVECPDGSGKKCIIG